MFTNSSEILQESFLDRDSEQLVALETLQNNFNFRQFQPEANCSYIIIKIENGINRSDSQIINPTLLNIVKLKIKIF